MQDKNLSTYLLNLLIKFWMCIFRFYLGDNSNNIIEMQLSRKKRGKTKTDDDLPKNLLEAT